jgi:hypothetical protein
MAIIASVGVNGIYTGRIDVRQPHVMAADTACGREEHGW